MAQVEVQTPGDEKPEAGTTEEASTDTEAQTQTTTEQAVPEAPQAESQPADAPVKSGSGLKLGKLKPSGRTVVEVLMGIAIVALALWSWTLYSDKQNLNEQITKVNNNPQLAVQKQTNDLIKSVGKLYHLPANEQPTIASVTDAAQAKKQSAFFNDAKNGDKVLMYVKAGEAILYRPSTNKIILVAPLTFSNTVNTSNSSSK